MPLMTTISSSTSVMIVGMSGSLELWQLIFTGTGSIKIDPFVSVLGEGLPVHRNTLT